MFRYWLLAIVWGAVSIAFAEDNDFVDVCFDHEGEKPPHCEFIDFDDVFQSSSTDIKFNWSFITKLTISNKKIIGVPTKMFASLPNLESFIVLNSLFYREIDPNSFVDCNKLNHIEITGTNITLLDSHMFPKTPKLQYLLFHHNRIAEIKHDAFEFLGELEELNLSYNNLTRLPSGVFHKLRKLKTLDLNHNRLLLLSFDSWFPPDGAVALTYLDASYNQLVDMSWTEISVRKVNLKYNNLTSVHVNGNCSEFHASHNAIDTVTVGRNCSLEKLYLAHNRLQGFDWLQRCADTLRSLDISHNLQQKGTDFLNLKQITALNIECTNISLNYKTLHDLRKLRFLDISYNNLKKIDLENLTSQRLLERLMISGNPIANISIGSIKRNFPNLKSLGIYDLPWNSTSLSIAIDDLKKHDIQPYIRSDYLFDESKCPLKVTPAFGNETDHELGDDDRAGERHEHGREGDKTADLLVGITLSAVVSFDSADAALCMCHPASCVVINANSTVLNHPEMFCPANIMNINDLLILRYNDTILTVDSFAPFTNLTSIEIFQGSLSRIEPGAFEKTPALFKIIIRSNVLSALEDYTFRGLDALHILYLISNNLTSIAPNAFYGLKNLTQLVLSGNQIAQLPPTLFSSTPMLRSVSLSNNMLTELPAGIFDSIDYLFKLDLSYNQLKTFDFPDLKVTLLFLHNNSLTSLHVGDHVKVVQANHNRIAKLSGSGFNITDLLLSDNAITDVTPIMLMKNISKLSLSNNPLQPDSVFGSLEQLEELFLSHTSIMINEQTFANLSWMSLLDLSYNNMTELDFRMFSSMNKLKSLIVAYNRIETINFIELREYLPELRVLEICGNGWNATYMERMLSKMRKHKLRADMQGLSNSLIFSSVFVELCSAGVETTTKAANDYSDYYAEDFGDGIEQEIAEYASSSPRPWSTVSEPMKAGHIATTVAPMFANEPTASVRLNTMVTADVVVPPAEQQPVVGSSPLYVTFQVLVYTFSVFGIVCLGVLAYHMRKRRFDVRRATSVDKGDSVRLV
uniref:LRRCT domain-containing protein n=1 Tax=Anopheles coluzzii TaxID=1518534 RepID=A0A8W7PMX7_ANOCL